MIRITDDEFEKFNIDFDLCIEDFVSKSGYRLLDEVKRCYKVMDHQKEKIDKTLLAIKVIDKHSKDLLDRINAIDKTLLALEKEKAD